MNLFTDRPGLLFVVATLLPLVSFLLVLAASALWCVGRRYRDGSKVAESLYQLTGGDVPGKTPALVALGGIFLAFVCSATGFVLYQQDYAHHTHAVEEARSALHEIEHPKEKGAKPDADKIKAAEKTVATAEKAWEARRKGTADDKGAWKATLFELFRLRPAATADAERSTSLTIGFAIDSLSSLMFVMVTFIATLIHLFSMGYMKEEAAEQVEDHHVHTEYGHFHRRGRFGRFFMYLSLFCFSMLNLLLADNLFQIFVSWELVGVCSFLLIGFYFERQSASNAANKAFITNRVGDAGFIIGLLVIWAYVGTFDFEGIFARVRGPVADSHGEMKLAAKIVRAKELDADKRPAGGRKFVITQPGEAVQGDYVALFPRERGGHFHALGAHADEHGHGQAGEEAHDEDVEFTARDNPSPKGYGVMPYWMLVAAGLGIFLGCVGKSAQFPLQVWLPDAMEGPTPVSALIHAATMVAAGVYLVGRCYPLFTPEVLLVIAYTGAITLFVAATIAIVATDIKKVLAYSTVSQLGYMMLALGIGGWTAGLFHLVTHAFFKALLFLGSGSVIYGCHHEQEMPKMGGLYAKMRITALTMLMGVFAIAGVPLFSGWYSKDSIVAQALGYAYVHPQHGLLFILPLLTAGVTTFYMLRMWLMTFTGKPRDHHVYEHAHESPWMMTTPLILLGTLSVCVAWGWPLWDATASKLEHAIAQSQPTSVLADFGPVADHGGGHGDNYPAGAAKPENKNERHFAHKYHGLAGLLALGVVGLGVVFALVTYYYNVLDPNEAKEQFPGVYALLVNKWYFDAVYSVLLARPVMIVARAFTAADQKGIDGALHGIAGGAVKVARGHGYFDTYFVDRLVNVVGTFIHNIGTSFRNVQTGSLRNYVLFLVLAAGGLFLLLTYFVAMATAG